METQRCPTVAALYNTTTTQFSHSLLHEFDAVCTCEIETHAAGFMLGYAVSINKRLFKPVTKNTNGEASQQGAELQSAVVFVRASEGKDEEVHFHGRHFGWRRSR